jgi:hypothetical protein
MQRFDDLVKEFSSSLSEQGTFNYYSILDQGERHGSYEWTWAAQSEQAIRYALEPGELRRFVSLAITPLQDLGPPFIVEVWAGADDDGRFGRYLVARWNNVTLDEILGGVLKNDLSTTLEHAAVRADSLKPRDLLDTRLTTTTIDNPVLAEHLGQPPR